MAVTIVTEPSVEPVSVTEAKDHLRVIGTMDNNYITGLIAAARGMVEGYIERSLITQSLELVIDGFLGIEIVIPRPPLISVTSLKYYDSSNDLQTMSADDYYVDAKTQPGRIIPVDSWPSTYDRPNAVTVTYSAGYGVFASFVPMPIRQAILLLVAEMYQNRGESIAGSVSTLPITAERLLSPYRMMCKL